MMEPAIGIYLGTDYSCVGVWCDGSVKIIPNEQGNMKTPSCVAFTPDQKLLGEAAKNQADINPTNTIFDMNHLIGRRFSDPNVRSDRKLWPFNVIEGAGDKPKIVVQYRGEEKQFFPEELSAMILAKMKEIAKSFLNCSDVRDVVVTVPAYFNDSQRLATRDAGAIAGLRVVCIMDEPTAAAVAYSFNYDSVIQNVLVFDLSISTFDVSVVKYNNGEYMIKTTAGDTHLGGKDFDNRLLNYFLQQIKREHNKDISDNPRSIKMLRSSCERAKKALSVAASTTVKVACLYEGIDFSSNITRDQFDEINMDLFERCMGFVTKCLEDIHMEKTDIDGVVLVGGNTQIPMVQKMLQELFDGKDLCKSINLDSVVAYGATLQSAITNYCPAPVLALRDIENANQERAALQFELSDAQKLTKKLMSERDDARELLEMVHKQLMCEQDDARKRSEATQKLTEQLISERDDAKKHLEAAQKLTEQLMSERDNAQKHSKAAQKLREQLMSERNDTKKHSEVVQKLTEQLMSERDEAKKHSGTAQKLTEQLMSERDEAQKHSGTAQKLIEQLMSERDDAKKHSEAAQKLIKQLISEKDDAIKQVEELRRLTEQQAPSRKCVGCFILYSYAELKHATNNFHESFKLGEGGFGKVYKAIIHDTTIAIKILNEGSSQGAKEFFQEVEVLSKLQHPNLVKLIGACAENHALVYEYLPNGSLEDRLQCKDNTSPLSWQARVCIAFEICSALSFLHCIEPHGIVHGDLKPDNVLLDLKNVSKLSDFGLCRQLNWTTNASRPFYLTDCPKGTIGYIDPDYVTTGKMTPQNDIYSFGIMLLQLVTCKDPRGIRQSVEEADRKGTLKELIDASAGPWPFKEAEKMISLGLRCSDTMRINRPELSTVVLKEMKSMADVASASQSSWAASLFRR